MEKTAVEFLEEMMTIALGEHHMSLFINEFNKAKKIENEQKHESINVQVDILRDTLDVGRDDIFKVDVKEGFSFFNTDAELADKVMAVLNEIKVNGRKINVEISKNDGGKNQGRRDHGGRDRKRDGGGFSGRRDGGNREGGFRREGGAPRSDSRPRRDGGSERRFESREGGRRTEGRSERRTATSSDSRSMFDKAKRSRRS